MFKSIEVEKLVDPFVDTGNLLLIDKDPLDPNVDERFGQKRFFLLFVELRVAFDI